MDSVNLNPSSNAMASFYRLIRGSIKENESSQPDLGVPSTQLLRNSATLARIDNSRAFLIQSFELLNEIYKQLQTEQNSNENLFVDFHSIDQTSFEPQIDENINKLESAVSRVSNITKLSTEEKEVLDCFTGALTTFKYLSRIVDDVEYCDKYNISRNMVKSSLSDLQEAFGYFNEWLISSDINVRYKTAEKQKKDEKLIIEAVIQGKGKSGVRAIETRGLPDEDLNPQVLTMKDGLTPTKDVERRQIYSFSSVRELNDPKFKEVYVGRIDKDQDVGNGLYITSTGFLDGTQGEQKEIPIGLKDITNDVIDFHDFESILPQRSKDEIDIELPLSIPSIAENESIVLPSHIGFKLHALSLSDQDGWGIPLDGIVIKSDVLGVPRLYNVPSYACNVKYRLKEDKSEGEKIDVNDDWTRTYDSGIPDSKQASPIEKAIELAKTRKEKVDLIKTLIASRHPIYTVHEDIRNILSVAKRHNYYDVQEALGLMGHCEHMSLYFANKVRQHSVPVVLVSGNTIAHTDQGFQFIANIEHAQPMWIDEENNKHFEEATHLRSIDYSLCKERLEEDLPYVIQAVSALEKESFINLLRTVSGNWKQFTNVDSEYRRTIGSSILGRNLEAAVSTLGDDVRTAYISSHTLNSLIQELPQFYASSNVNDIVDALDRIDPYSEKNLYPEYRGPKASHVVHALSRIDDYTQILTKFACGQAAKGVAQEPILELLLLARSRNFGDEFINWVSQYDDQNQIQEDLLRTLFRASAEASYTHYKLEHANKVFALVYPCIDRERLMPPEKLCVY